jgi:hypothetical protein
MVSWFEYPVTRPFTIPNFTVTLVFLGVIYSTIITCINMAAVGYEVYPITSDSFNISSQLWYEKIFPQRGHWFPASRTCEGSIIKMAEGSKNY